MHILHAWQDAGIAKSAMPRGAVSRRPGRRDAEPTAPDRSATTGRPARGRATRGAGAVRRAVRRLLVRRRGADAGRRARRRRRARPRSPPLRRSGAATRRADSTTRAPCCANRPTSASPIPDEAPVTHTTLSSRSMPRMLPRPARRAAQPRPRGAPWRERDPAPRDDVRRERVAHHPPHPVGPEVPPPVSHERNANRETARRWNPDLVTLCY